MGSVRHSSVDPCEGVEELQEKPCQDEPIGPDRKYEVNHEGDHSRSRKEEQVRAQDPRDCRRGSDARNEEVRGSAEIGQVNLCHRPTHTGDEVEEQVTKVSEPVLHVVTEDEEKEHIPEDVNDSCVKEHRSQERVETEKLSSLQRTDDLTGDDAVLHEECLCQRAREVFRVLDFVEEDENVKENQPPVDDGPAFRPIEVVEWQQRVSRRRPVQSII